MFRCEAIADQTDKRKVRVTRHCHTLAEDGIVVARAGSTAMDQTMVGAGSPARVDGWITKSRNDVKANFPNLGTSDSSAIREACTGTGSGERRHLSIESWIQEVRRKTESQLVGGHDLDLWDLGIEVIHSSLNQRKARSNLLHEKHC